MYNGSEAERPTVAEYCGLTEVFDTRSFSGSGVISRGVQAAPHLAEQFQARQALSQWKPNPRYPRDRRSAGTHFTHADALRDRLMFHSHFTAYAELLHGHAAGFGRRVNTLGYLSLVSSAGFCTMIYHTRKREPSFRLDRVPPDILQVSESHLGISYVAHALLALGVNPGYEADTKRIVNFVIESPLLVGSSTICPIQPEFLASLINLLKNGDGRSTQVKSETISRILELGRVYEEFRLATALPWSSKPQDEAWSGWTKDQPLTPEAERTLLECDRDARRILGHPADHVDSFSGQELHTMRRELTVERDDLTRLAHRVFPPSAFR